MWERLFDNVCIKPLGTALALQLPSGGNAEVALNIRKDAITKRTCFLYVPGTQREAQTFGRCVRLMNCDVAPPYTAVVPQVVVDIAIVNTKRDFGLL